MVRAACARRVSGKETASRACPRQEGRVTLPRMFTVFLVALVVGFLTLVGGMFVTPEWN
jgi:hypothetical protein